MGNSLPARWALGAAGALHIGFAALEMVLWTTPTGRDIFGLTEPQAADSAALAFNQGLYNLFIAAGLFWAAATARRDIGLFFAGCVVVAGIVGALTVSVTILWVQALPGAVAFGLTAAARRAA